MISFTRASKHLVCVLAITCILALLLSACTQQSPSTSSSGTSSSSSTTSSSSSSFVSSSSSADTTSSEIATANADDVMVIDLDYNAGTGYAWQWELDPEGVVEIISEGDLEMGEDAEEIVGGPLIHSMTLHALSPGSTTLTCKLVRDWEQDLDPAEVQKFVFTVDEDLKISFNRDASDCTNEPAAISSNIAV